MPSASAVVATEARSARAPSRSSSTSRSRPRARARVAARAESGVPGSPAAASAVGERLGDAARVAEAVQQIGLRAACRTRFAGAVARERPTAPLDGGRRVQPAVPVDPVHAARWSRPPPGRCPAAAARPRAGRAAAPRWPGRRRHRQRAEHAVAQRARRERLDLGRRSSSAVRGVAAQQQSRLTARSTRRCASPGSGLSRAGVDQVRGGALARPAGGPRRSAKRARSAASCSSGLGAAATRCRSATASSSTSAAAARCRACRRAGPERVVDRGADQRVRERQRPRQLPVRRHAAVAPRPPRRRQRPRSSTSPSAAGQRERAARARAPPRRRRGAGWRRRMRRSGRRTSLPERARRRQRAGSRAPTRPGGNSSSSALA